MDPMGMIKTMLGKNMNPQQIVMSMMKNNQNPILNDLMKQVNSGNTKGVETFARNLCKQKGMNFDDEFGKFMNNFK